ncbi:MAG: pyridoxamine 5'-phosphate oxidase family protein [Actinomycetota bacterium]
MDGPSPPAVTPRAGRPHMPGYGIARGVEGTLPWAWAVDLLGRARTHVVTSVRPGGRPHAMPVWGIWHAGAYRFSTAITSVKSRNLLAEPRCVVTATEGDDALVLEGRAELSPLPPGFTDAYRDRYGETIEEGPIWLVRPTVAFAFQATAAFPTTATRWRF